MFSFNPANPLIVQGDMTLLLELNSPRYADAADLVAQFADLTESPDYIHKYQITSLSLWNAASAGMTIDAVIDTLTEYARYPVPEDVVTRIRTIMGRFGVLRLNRAEDGLILASEDPDIISTVLKLKTVTPLLGEKIDACRIKVAEENRGLLKQALTRAEYPVEDFAGFLEGAKLPMQLRDTMISGREFNLRQYQVAAVDAFFNGHGGSGGGSGVLVLPCGAGKTVIGITAMSRLEQKTLVLTTNVTALRQWMAEVIDKTTLTPDQVGEYSGDKKEVKPVTVSTYQLMTYRKARGDEFAHMELFNKEEWGLIIYDEVHMLPAPVFRSVAGIQARRRMGLTATLVREDNCEGDVFSLIGPNKFQMPWKQLEQQGWIASAKCVEIRIPMPKKMKVDYAASDKREQFRMASENPLKMSVVHRLIERHRGDNILIIGQYLDQLDMLQKEFKAPIITGKTPNKERDEIYCKFKKKEITLLIVSKVANFAIDLPDANVAIQVSGTFGSRQEEAQRLGRVLRPKGEGIENVAHFYTVITHHTQEQRFAEKRQTFLAQQGYRYQIEVEDVLEEEPEASTGKLDKPSRP